MNLAIILWISAFCGVAVAETWPECQAKCKSKECGASWNSRTGCKCVSCLDSNGRDSNGLDSKKAWDNCIVKCRSEKCNPTYSSSTGCKCIDCIQLKNTVNGQQKQLFVELHNKYRRQVALGQTKEPAAADMMQVVWDDKIAAVAQNWANKCTFTHSGGNYGENLADHPSIESAVKGWYDEINFYDFNSVSCSGVCGHYTQVVWGNTARIGCGINLCKGSAKITNAYIVCNYTPPGNFVGEQPYKLGQACSQCPSNTQCNNGLCA